MADTTPADYVSDHAHHWTRCDGAFYCASCGSIRVQLVRVTAGGNVTTAATRDIDMKLIPAKQYADMLSRLDHAAADVERLTAERDEALQSLGYYSDEARQEALDAIGALRERAVNAEAEAARLAAEVEGLCYVAGRLEAEPVARIGSGDTCIYCGSKIFDLSGKRRIRHYEHCAWLVLCAMVPVARSALAAQQQQQAPGGEAGGG